MKLLNSYECKDEAEKALVLITGEKRLASERDGTEVIYNLFGVPSWGNFYKLGMFGLAELEAILDKNKKGFSIDSGEYSKIMTMLKNISSIYSLDIPKHWLL
ncbi:TPA: hypothetical protein ACOEFP_004760 [Enterobacter bugandensis]|uniref:Uncharacterized protein n=1 Tax=Enterobacter bugandensis TaxID=881260 RepID=A0A822WQ86_9ENTR|nr:hypothetical protein [Enterobacter bugandensis]MCK7398650.1 hypothetical protein [Enterobacter bugandensis]QCE26649.1 hypothetical protein FAI37_03990 [Enterobacter bugandensis]CZX45512.1 Uncharacterised protein [Enterobacter bugandensis]